MEYYGLYKAKKQTKLVVTSADLAQLIRRYPSRLKEVWGDLGVCPYHFEIYQTVCLLDYESLSSGATINGDVMIVSLEKLLLTSLINTNEKISPSTIKLITNQIHHDLFGLYNEQKEKNEHLLESIPNIKFLDKQGPEKL